jgi:hypothetical protein
MCDRSVLETGHFFAARVPSFFGTIFVNYERFFSALEFSSVDKK